MCGKLSTIIDELAKHRRYFRSYKRPIGEGKIGTVETRSEVRDD